MRYSPGEAAAAARAVLAAMDELGIPCYIGGSLASSAHGASRSTIDADLVADIASKQVDDLIAKIEPDYITDAESIRYAVTNRESFNVLHRTLMVKVDVFVLKRYKYERQVFDHIKHLPLDPARPDELLPFCSVEDIILNKLMWFDNAGRQSERQWTDLTTVIRVQAGALDRAYLAKWAKYLDIESLLQEVLTHAAEQDGR